MTRAVRLSPSFAALCTLGLAALPLKAEETKVKELWTELSAGQRHFVEIPSIAPLVERIEAASLVILTEGDAERHGEGPALPPGHPPMPSPEGGPFGVRGQGSGFLIHPAGYALTNHHVIEGARRIRVVVGRDSREVNARVVGTDPKTDVALIQLMSSKTDWPAVPLGDSDALRVGDFVVAIGNPFGLERSVSLGILSARGRRDISPSGRAGLYDFLQTDASINFGNSGGPLLNLAGEVVGMNTAINAAAQGIGFAIPINMIKRMLPELRREGRLVRSWLGVGIQKVSPELARSFGLERPRGALIRQVLDDGPAAKAGVLPGDIIMRFGSYDIQDANELPLVAGDEGVGRTVPVVLLRDGREHKLAVTLGEHPDNLPARPADAEVAAKTLDKGDSIGLSVVTLDDDDRGRLGLEGAVKGARVVNVRFGSPAFQAGLRPDDIIQKVNGSDVEEAKDFARVVKGAKNGEVLRLFVLREGGSLFVALQRP